MFLQQMIQRYMHQHPRYIAPLVIDVKPDHVYEQARELIKDKYPTTTLHLRSTYLILLQHAS
jgi:hypothetical protein